MSIKSKKVYFCAGDHFIKLSELGNYNFNRPSFNFYEGAVY